MDATVGLQHWWWKMSLIAMFPAKTWLNEHYPFLVSLHGKVENIMLLLLQYRWFHVASFRYGFYFCNIVCSSCRWTSCNSAILCNVVCNNSCIGSLSKLSETKAKWEPPLISFNLAQKKLDIWPKPVKVPVQSNGWMHCGIWK